jgi:peptide methionine sulfoxide reductase msrA/msrB
MKNLFKSSKKKYIIYVLFSMVIYLISFTLYNTYNRSNSPQYKIDINMEKEINLKLNDSTYEKIILAGGCFWCTEAEFNHDMGIISAISGYTDSEKENPTYEEVAGKKVKAREAVEVIYNPRLTSLETVLEKYWKHIDPVDTGGQFGDRGYSYTTAIYYTTDTQKELAIKIKTKIEEIKKIKVATEILPFVNFYPAEEYHQDYKDKNPIRYNGYREVSGRNSYIRLYWQDGSTTTKAIFELDTESVNTNLNQDKNIQEVKSFVSDTVESSKIQENYWLNFTPETKTERLKSLTKIQFEVTQKEGTERPFSEGNLNDNKEVGIYVDIVSGEPLFLSSDKYDSGTGWPSFVRPIDESHLTLHTDVGIFSTRTEVRSKIADSHLGHVFNDGPKERGGMRYCMNGAAMRFVRLSDMEREGYADYINLLN